MDVRFDIGKRQSGKTTRLLNQAAFDMADGKVNYAILIFPNEAMLYNAKSLIENLYLIEFEKNCLFVSVNNCLISVVRKLCHSREKVGIYFDEVLLSLCSRNIYVNWKNFMMRMFSIASCEIACFSGCTPKYNDESNVLEQLKKMTGFKEGVEL